MTSLSLTDRNIWRRILSAGSFDTLMCIRLTCSKLAATCRDLAGTLWQGRYGDVSSEPSVGEWWRVLARRHFYRSCDGPGHWSVSAPSRLLTSVHHVSTAIDLMLRSLDDTKKALRGRDAVVQKAIEPLVLAAAMRVPGTKFSDMNGDEWVAENLAYTAGNICFDPVSVASQSLQWMLLAALQDDLLNYFVVQNEEDAVVLCGSMAHAIKGAILPKIGAWERSSCMELKTLLDGLYYPTSAQNSFVLWGRKHVQVLMASIRGDNQALRSFERFESFVAAYWRSEGKDTDYHTIFECCSHTCESVPTHHAKEYLGIKHMGVKQLHAFLVLASVRFDIEAFCRVMVALHHNHDVSCHDDVFLELLSQLRAINIRS